jgi:hypothetical protein
MEADGQETTSTTKVLMEPVDIHHTILQDQIKWNDLKMSTDFQLMAQANDEFKRDVRMELDDLHCLMSQQQNLSRASTNVMYTDAIGPTPSPVCLTTLPIPSSLLNSNNSSISTSSPESYPSVDIQTQMMLMLTESISKLSTILVDKNSDT